MALIQGSNAANRLSARANGDTVEGLAGNDLLDSGSTALTGVYLFGGDGKDTLTARANDALIDGGAGVDTVRFAANVASLGDGVLEGVEKVLITSTTDGGQYNFVSQTEALDITGSRMVDSISGGSGNDTITGGTGADSLYGGAGDDVIVAEATDAVIDGGVGSGAGLGGGNDTVQFAEAVSRTDLANGDLLYVENIVITNKGNAAYDFGLQSEALNITGGRGKDTITGGQDADTLRGGNGNDVLIAVGTTGASQDALVDGGAGNDTVKYAADVTSLDDAKLTNVEYVVITNDTAGTYDFSSQTEGLDITGNVASDIIKGGSGADALRGGGGADTLHVADNDKLIDGGGGSDTAVFAAGVTAKNLMDGDLINVETISITNTSDAAYDFSSQSEQLSITGGGANDTITGGKAADTLNGGAGDDVIVASDLDVIDGGVAAGNDTVRFAAAVSAVNLGDTDLQDIDNIVITNTKAATYDFSVQTEVLNIAGGSGNDTIIGGTVADTLSGGAGNDVLVATGSDALIDGGTGTDAAYFGAAVTDALTDAELINVENILLTAAISANFSIQTESLQISGSSGGDTIYGGSRADTIIGGAGADTLYGNEGADILVAETGDASIIGGAGDDTVKFAAAVAGGHATDWLVGVENVVITNTGSASYDFGTENEALNITGNSGADSITGGLAADTLSGGAGNDVLVATATDALIDGGAGTDTVQFAASVTALQLLNADLVNVENVVLTTGATVDLSSQTEALNVTGSSGNDVITGGAGADTLRGGAGDDTLVASATDALIDGGSDTSQASSPGAGDTVQFASDVTAVNLTNAKLVDIENVVITKTTAGSYDFSAQTEALKITGGAAADTITGTQDWDTFVVSATADVDAGESYNGGAGTDTLSLSVTGTADLSGLTSLTSVEVIAWGASATEVTFAASALTGDTIAVNGLSSGATDKLKVDGTSSGDTINLAGLTLTDIAGVTINGLGGDDVITGTAGADTITGGAGADQITTGSGADVIVLAASGDSTAPTAVVEAGSPEKLTVTEAAGDVVTGDVSDTFDIVASGGAYTAVTATTVLVDGAIDTTTYATAGLDVFVYKDGTDYYLAYETAAGTAATFGALETVKLVGIVDANDTFAVSASGIVSFAAVA